MTHQQLIDYWANDIKVRENMIKVLSSPLQIEKAKVRLEVARLIYMQLCMMDSIEPATLTHTDI